MEEIKLDHLSKNTGSFIDALWFVDKFKTYPDTQTVYCKIEEMSIDDTKFFNKLKESYPEFTFWVNTVSAVDGELTDDVLDNIDRPYYTHDTLQFRGVSTKYKCSISYYSSNMQITYLDKLFVEEFIKTIHNISKECSFKPNSSKKVNLVTYDGQDYNLTECKIMNADVDIDKHYNDDFKPIYNDIAEFLNNPKSGLVMLHGLQGTGKTYMIRHLINNFDKQFIIVNNSMMNSISDPVFLNFILDHKNSVIILEDCEQLLKDRSENVFTNGIANILNMTDGLYSDILNIKFIATFNSAETSIDPALMRKGRLIAKYKFDELSLDKTNNLLKELGKPKATKGMSLAEIYNSDSKSYEHQQRRKVGF